MASLTVNVPDDQASRIIAAFAAQAFVTPTTQSEGVEVVRRAVFAYLRDQTLLYEAQLAREAVLTNGEDPLVNATVDHG